MRHLKIFWVRILSECTLEHPQRIAAVQYLLKTLCLLDFFFSLLLGARQSLLVS